MSATDRHVFHQRFISFCILDVTQHLGWSKIQALFDADAIQPERGSASIYSRANLANFLT
ncbi:hypothetical protein [Paracoccus sp. 08]|uniref:hypothetical protein n=1 Tax=Paracoccus sp. 08 TaxID=2606624 RepID=UPI002094309A|nr:hypothetical protein [Paracoccus sp. 08]MCO6363453.1 hypothetical protein [Paracoccus sp. 08]